MRSNYKRLGDYIREVNNRDSNVEVDLLLGVSIQKKFIPSIANIIGTDMSTYKIIRKNQFAYGPVTSRNGDKISIALLENIEEAIVSQAYTVFEISDFEQLHPEYLMMWFRRPEFDRYTRFMSHGSAREIFGWDEMCNSLLPVPSIYKQKEIVKEYNVIINRIALNSQLIQKLEETAQSIYKQWFVDFEFPDENGNLYKSSGGNMIDDKFGEIPYGWTLSKMSDLYTFQYGLGNNNPSNGGQYPVYGSNGIIGGYDKFNNEDTPIIGHIGENCGSLVYANDKYYVTYNGVMCNIKEGFDKYFGYCTLLSKDLKSQTRGSSQPFISYDILYDIDIVLPNRNMMDKISNVLNPLFERMWNNIKQNNYLVATKDLLLSKLTIIENKL